MKNLLNKEKFSTNCNNINKFFINPNQNKWFFYWFVGLTDSNGSFSLLFYNGK